jgi:ABC-type Mn2+/Zn2+ transport system ATPase subunit
VKLVLAAAMWNNPHLLIMDEPTNYLDRVRSGPSQYLHSATLAECTWHAAFALQLCMT